MARYMLEFGMNLSMLSGSPTFLEQELKSLTPSDERAGSGKSHNGVGAKGRYSSSLDRFFSQKVPSSVFDYSRFF